MTDMNDDPVKTAAWMTKQGVHGTPEEIAVYAQDWLDVCVETGVPLNLVRPIPSRERMFRRAEQILREKTRTRVIDGYRVFVQVRDVMRFGHSENPGVRIGIVSTNEPDTAGWTLATAGDFRDDLRFEVEKMTAPVKTEFRADVQNNLGKMGAYVIVWPSEEDLYDWIENRARQMIARAKDERSE